MLPYLYREANEAEMPEQEPLAKVDDDDLALRMMEENQDALRSAIKAYPTLDLALVFAVS